MSQKNSLVTARGTIDRVKNSSHLVWSSSKLWLPCIIRTGVEKVPKLFGDSRTPHLEIGTKPGSIPRSTPLPNMCYRTEFGRHMWRKETNNRVPPLFQHWFSMTFPWPKMKIHDLSAQHILPSKRYTTYECIPELVVTVPSAPSTIVKKIKRFIIWLYKWSRVTFTELLSAVVKIPWHYHHIP